MALTTFWFVLKCIMRYLLHKYSFYYLYAFVDADWAENMNDKIFTSAYIIFLKIKIIRQSFKKYYIITRSTTKAKWVTSPLYKLDITSQSTPIIHCDTISITYYAP